MPMLDEEEFECVYRLYDEGMRATKEFRQKWNIPLENATSEQRMWPVRLP
jgi:hypothetical protein